MMYHGFRFDVLLSSNYDFMPREVWEINRGNIPSEDSMKGGTFITDYRVGMHEG